MYVKFVYNMLSITYIFRPLSPSSSG